MSPQCYMTRENTVVSVFFPKYPSILNLFSCPEKTRDQRFSKCVAGLPRRGPNSFRGGSVMEVKKYYISYYISYQKEITYYSLSVCDLVKEIVQRYIIFGEFYCFSHFPIVRN